MNLFFYIFLFIFGSMFGSFASVIIYRLKSGESGIWTGRSHCKTCERNLSALELIPILSWLFQEGKCKWCRQKISSIYPLLEFSTGILFVATWIFLIDVNLILSGNLFEWGRMLFFLSIMFLTIIYVFYDILYLEIPESILLIANISVFGALILQEFGFPIFPYLPTGWAHIPFVPVALLIVWSLYTICLAGLRELYDCIIVLACILLLWTYLHISGVSFHDSALISGTIAALGIYISFFLQIILSQGRAMGAGDLRIAILMGLIVGTALAFPAWMICYLAWSLIWIIIILQSKIKNDFRASFQHQVPFGPFIAIGYLAVLFFSQPIEAIIAWYF